MNKFLAVVVTAFLYVGCGDVPKTVDGVYPFDIETNGKIRVIDMGIAEGTINNKPVHCNNVLYPDVIGNGVDHIYVIENVIAVNQPEGKVRRNIQVIVENDTFTVN